MKQKQEVLLELKLNINNWLSYKQIFSSENDWPNEANLLMKHLWKIFYKDYSFRPDPFTNMVVTSNSLTKLPVAAMFVNGSRRNE
jgi:hypothetical protein